MVVVAVVEVQWWWGCVGDGGDFVMVVRGWGRGEVLLLELRIVGHA
jgi:hypothetical protein